MATHVRSSRSHLESPASPRQLPALTDDLLEEILLRIACPADLVRASAACAAFRRLITDPTFLRRYRSRRPPLLLGFLDLEVDKGFHAVEAPHPNAPAARALANVCFDYLPSPILKDWYICDVCDGRVLFGCVKHVQGTAVVTGLAVCDPSSLSRRYLILPPVTDADEVIGDPDARYFHAVFGPCAQEKDNETLFRVIGIVYYPKNLVVLVFDSASGNWTVRTYGSFDALQDYPWAILSRPQYACGCLYWQVKNNKLLKLDMNMKKFSRVDLPPDHDARVVVVVETEEGRLGMFSYSDIYDKFLYCNESMQDQRTNKWQMRKSIPLPDLDYLQIIGSPQGYVFIQGDSKVGDKQHTSIYSLDIKTLQFEMVTQMSYCFRGFPYFSFPPSTDQRRI